MLPLLEEEPYKKILYQSMAFVNAKYSAHIISYVFMPNHIHFIICFAKENKLIEYMRDFKKYTSYKITRTMSEVEGKESLVPLQYIYRKQVLKVWQDRFDDLYLFKTKTLLIKLNYIHENPVRKKLCDEASDYKHSSAAFYLKDETPLMPVMHFMQIV
ncbi:MAG: transposase [Bacteroidetes bacterium]|nr:transposase [Bacteroidota bacterium]